MASNRQPPPSPQGSAPPAGPLVDEDAPLVERFRGGDRGAFEEIVRKYEDPLVSLVHRYVKNDADAKDVVQRAFLRVFEKIDTFRGDAAFRTWLFRIAIHLALNHIRGRDRLQPAELDDIAAFTNALETGRLVAAELWQKVVARLAELPPKQRLVVELRLFHELSFREISALADCSEESAKANYHHGVKRLRSIIQKV
jgi:RNA polymerase sigma-70 factor (ECF subfamily)